MSHILVTCEWVMARMNESWHMRMSHVTYECAMLHQNESLLSWSVACKCTFLMYATIMYAHIHKHAYIFTDIYPHTYIFMCVRVHIHIYACVCTCTCVCVCKCICVHIYIHAYIHTYIHTHTYIYTYTHTWLYMYLIKHVLPRWMTWQ